MKVFVDALGCPKALVDAEKLCAILENNGYKLSEVPENAEAIIINTCGFIQKAKEENIDTILQYASLKLKKPSLKIIVSGCLSERYGKELLKAVPEVDNAIGVRDPGKILKALSNKREVELLDKGEFKDFLYKERKLYFSGYSYAYLKISEGCDRSCSFCSIPAIRGKQRSRTIESILEEADLLQRQGIKELVLVSEDTLSYGLDIYKKRALLDLLNELIKKDFVWIRLMYLYPDEYLYSVVEWMARKEKICKYIDVPLQHASDKILKAMKRSGSYSEYLKMFNYFRKVIPEISIRSSFIVGYPGETEKDFNILKDFLSEARLNRVGFFEYSDEEGTDSFQQKDKIPVSVAKKRIRCLAKLQADISRELLEKRVGKVTNCIYDGIIEEDRNGKIMVLRSEYDAPEIDGKVYLRIKKESEVEEDFFPVLIEKVKGFYDLEGKRITGSKL